MRKKNGIILPILLCLCLMLNMATVYAAETDPLSGAMTIDGEQITVVVNLAENSGATNGEVQVSYDPAKLTLVSADGSDLWDVEDINETYEAATVSAMYASAEAVNEGGAVLTLVFTAAQDCDTYEAEVTTKLYADQKPITDSDDETCEEVTFTVSAEKAEEPTEGTTDPSEEATEPSEEATQEATEPSQNQGGNSGGVQTGDDTNLMLWFGLVFVSAAAIILMTRRKVA